MNDPKIVTIYDPKPIATRKFDWMATTDHWDLGDPAGYGATEAEAIADLQEMIDWDDRGN